MSFFEAVVACFSKYATFSGRASRAEFWWFALFNILAALMVLNLVASFAGPDAGTTVVMIYNLAILLPSLAVGARRLHDMGYTGWWQLLHVTGLGSLILLVWMMFAGNPGANRFGEPVVTVDS